MFYNYYIFSKQPTCLMEFRVYFHFMTVYTLKLVTLKQFWLLSLKGLVISVHMSFSPLVEKMCDLTEVMVDKTKL